MSRYLALDAELGQVYLASAVVKGSAVKVEKAICLPNEGTLTAANAAERGRRLKESLKEAGIAPAPVLVSVGRERVVLKEVKYPAGVSPADEPALVKFQMSKELAEGGDSVVIDYFSLPTLDPDGQRRALAFAIRKDVLAPLRALCLAAGLKLVGVTPRPFGIAASLMRAVKDGAVTAPASLNGPIAILVRGDKWGELVILRDGQVAFTRSLTGMALGSEAAMLGEIRRNLAVFSGPSAQNQVQALFVAEGDLPGGWAGRVRAGLSIPVQSFDPVAGTETDVPLEARGSFTGLVGLTALQARSSELPVNFLTPHEPKQVRDPNKRMLAGVAAAALLLIVGSMAYGLHVVGEKSDAVDALQAEKTEIEEDLKKREDVGKRYTAVKDWQLKGVNWLDEFYDLTYYFPDPSLTEVIRLTADPFEDASKGAKKKVAKMTLELRTKTENSIDRMTDRIQREPTYASNGKEPMKNTTTNTPNGKDQHFKVVYRMEHREPNMYKLKLDDDVKAPEPKKPKGRGNVAGGFPDFGGAP